MDFDFSHDTGLLLILGTSLSVSGIQHATRGFARNVHDRNGLVVLVNRTKPPPRGWEKVIDYWVECDCDDWVADLNKPGFGAGGTRENPIDLT